MKEAISSGVILFNEDNNVRRYLLLNYPTGHWDFIKFGEVVIAFNGVDAPQAWTLDGSSDFGALAGSPPTFKHAAVVGNFVVTGFQPTAQTTGGWSSFNSRTSWTAGTNHSDT